ncbi:MAG: hypothetical protein WCC14_20775 [Acidobacteriaceae bacterium]
MDIQRVAYWGAFAIPLALIGLGIFIRSVVDGGKFKREHFYIGLDLTVYFMAAVMTNFLDIAKADPVVPSEIIYSVLLLLGGLFILFAQVRLHQIWHPSVRQGKMQLAALGFFSNILGVILLYTFVRLKARGLV